MQVWYSVFSMHQISSIVYTLFSTYKTAYIDACKTHYTIPVYITVFLKMNPSGSKHVEGHQKLKIKTLTYNRCLLLIYIAQLYYLLIYR